MLKKAILALNLFTLRSLLGYFISSRLLFPFSPLKSTDELQIYHSEGDQTLIFHITLQGRTSLKSSPEEREVWWDVAITACLWKMPFCHVQVCPDRGVLLQEPLDILVWIEEQQQFSYSHGIHRNSVFVSNCTSRNIINKSLRPRLHGSIGNNQQSCRNTAARAAEIWQRCGTILSCRITPLEGLKLVGLEAHRLG